MTDLADILTQAIGASRDGRLQNVMDVLDRIEQRAGAGNASPYSAPEPHVQAMIDQAWSDFLYTPGGEAAMRHLVEQFLWRSPYITPLADMDRDQRAEYHAMRAGQGSVVEMLLRNAMRHREEKPLPPR